MDSFDRADSVDLGTADTGQQWQQHAGVSTVTAGQAAMGPGYALATIISAHATGVVAVTLDTVGPEVWLVFRLADGANYWRFGRGNGGPYQLQHVTNNNLGSPAITTLATVQAADGDRLECRLAATTTCSVNGTAIARTTDSALSSQTRHGLAAYNSDSARFDDFLVTELPNAPDLAVVLTTPNQVAESEAVTVTAVVSNHGSADADEAVLTWTLPVELADVSATTSGEACSNSADGLACPLGSIAAGAEATVTLTATAPGTTSSLVVSGEVAHSVADRNPADDQATATIQVKADLLPGTVVSDGFDRADGGSPGMADTGQPWTVHAGTLRVVDQAAAPASGYTLASVDAGTATGVVAVTLDMAGPEVWLVFRLADGANYWRFGRGNGGPYQLQHVTNNNLGSPAITTLATVQAADGDRLECRLAATTTCSVNGTAIARTTDSALSSQTRHGLAAYNSDSARFDDFLVQTALPQPDLKTTVEAPGSVPGGGELDLELALTNGGDAAATGITLTVDVPTGASYMGASGDVTSCDTSGTALTCPLPNLAAGTTVAASIDFTAPLEPGTITFTAAVSAEQEDADPFDDFASATTLVHDASRPAPIVWDSFSRADSAALGSAETGQQWQVHHGSLGVADQQSVSGTGYTLASIPAGVPDGSPSVTVVQPGEEFWLVVRLADAQNFWRFGRSSGGPYQLQQIKNNSLGSPTLQVLQTVMPAAGDRVECRAGAGISCSVNGTAVARTSDTFATSADRYGVATWNSPGTRFDDFAVQPLPTVPDLVVGLTGSRSATVSGPLQYTASAINAGTSPAESTVLTIELPAGAGIISADPSRGSCDTSGTQVICHFGQLAAGADVGVTLEATAPAVAGSVTTTAHAQHSGEDAEPSNDQATLTTTLRMPAPPGAVVRDSFDRVTATPGQLGEADTGEPWTTYQGGFEVVDGEAAPSGPGTSLAAVDAGFSYGTVEVTLTSGADDPFWLALRVVDSGNYYRLGRDSWSGVYHLTKVVAGVPQPLHTNWRRADVEAQDGDVIRVVLRPDDGIYVYVNGEHVIDAGDQQFMDATGFGFLTSGTAPRFDDLEISSFVEAFPIADTFSRADDSSSLGTPEVGSRYPWRVWHGWAWGVEDGRARSMHDDDALVAIDASSEAAGVTATFATLGPEQWVVFRYAEDDSYYRFGATQTGHYEVQYVVGGDTAVLPVTVEQVTDLGVQAGQVVKVVQYLDGRVETLVDGQVTHRFSDTATNHRATIYGLATTGVGASFDDFAITLAPRPGDSE